MVFAMLLTRNWVGWTRCSSLLDYSPLWVILLYCDDLSHRYERIDRILKFFANAKVIWLYCGILSHRYERLGRKVNFFANAKVILLYCDILSHRYERIDRILRFFVNAKVIWLYCGILSHRCERLGRKINFFANAKVILLYCDILSHRYERLVRVVWSVNCTQKIDKKYSFHYRTNSSSKVLELPTRFGHNQSNLIDKAKVILLYCGLLSHRIWTPR